jgi:hypothetical protein
VRVVSRAASPQEIGIARDPRVLGVAVSRIVLRSDTKAHTIYADDPILADGFHDYEPNLGFRWTNGEATLSSSMFAGIEGSLALELHVAATGCYIADANCQAAA